MIYTIAEQDEKCIEIKQEIDSNEFERILNLLDNIGIYTHAKQLRDMSIKNGKILHDYLINTINRYSNPFEEVNNIGDILINANKYIYDFSISIRTFIEYLERVLESRNKKKEFESDFLSKLYDNTVEYKFWYYMRNYIVHYDMPFNTLIRDYDGLKIISENEHLLKYKKWKASTEYIKQHKQVPIIDLIKPMQSLIIAIFTQYLYFIVQDLEKMKNAIDELKEKYNLKSPMLVSYVNEEELRQGKIKVYPLAITTLVEAFKDLEEHPSVTVNIIEE